MQRQVLAADAWRGRLRPTLRGALLCASGEADCALAVASARKVSAACVRLRECPQLRASLHTVLAIGNALNKGRATAYAYSVVELERLACTKTNDNQTGYDFLAHVLEHDKQKRGEDGLDGAAIDAELRSVLGLLSDCADDVPRERTFEVQERLFTETKELVALLKASGAIGEASGTFDPEDDAACDAAAADVFTATAVAQLEEIDAARATLDAALLDLSTELTGLRERFDEPVLPIDDIFKALRNFASMLITARAKLLKKSAPSRS